MLLGMVAAASALVQTLLPPELPRGVGSWDTKGLGNHRIVIQVLDAKANVIVNIPWRRRDRNPEGIGVILTDSHGARIVNFARRQCTREMGEFIFEPKSGPGLYYLYFMPFEQEGTYYPKVHYLAVNDEADPAWKAALKAQGPEGKMERATPIRLESATDFDAFTPMEVIATRAETDALLAKHSNKPFLVFPEDRHLSIRMWDDLPYRWAKRGANMSFAGTAKRGEYYTLQLGVWASRTDLQDLKVRFSQLKLKGAKAPAPAIPSKAFTCFNTGGIDYKGHPFTSVVNVAKGKVQPLWCGVDVPVAAKPGTYVGSAVVSAQGLPETRIPISLEVTREVAKNHGDDHPGDMTRLRWLNSKLGQEPAVVEPFRSLKKEPGPFGHYLLTLGPNGLHSEIASEFDDRMDRISLPNRRLLVAPIDFVAEGSSEVFREKVEEQPKPVAQSNTTRTWSQSSKIGPLEKRVLGRLEFDGTIDYEISVTAAKSVDLKDIRLEIPISKEHAQYFMGLGRDGGNAPKSLNWKWDVKNAQEGAWVGSVNCGLMFALRDEHYVRPLNTNFYHEKPLVMPTSWCNGGNGGIRIRNEKDAYQITCYSGPRTMKKGETLHFNVHMMLTPFKLIDPKRHFSERYFHRFRPLDEIQKDGANVVNVHHATEINPWINYPFLGYSPRSSSAKRLMREGPGKGAPSPSLGFGAAETASESRHVGKGGVGVGDLGPTSKMAAYIADAHKRSMRVKIYDTIRELTFKAPELFMLKSLGHEVFSPGKGGGGSWLREHLDDDYIPAWHAVEVGDAAIINSGMSRWHNYYIEGLDWLARNVGIDGLYLDDVAFDRTTMLRVRRVLERRISERPSALANRQPLTADQSPSVPSPLRPFEAANRQPLTSNQSPSVPPSLRPSEAANRQPSTANRPSPIIDLHSANQHNERDGWNNSALLYMDLMPYLDRLWFGEYFDYDKGPDFWLIEMSGIPFGLMGEMLQNGGNPWRGMLFGMTARRPWSGDPRPLWKAWDAFGITQAEMIGWWAADCPVTTDNRDVLATVYLRGGPATPGFAPPPMPKEGPSALIAIASWAKETVNVKLNFDWEGLKMNPKKAMLVAKAIDCFQPAGTFQLDDPIPVEPGRGWLLHLSQR